MATKRGIKEPKTLELWRLYGEDQYFLVDPEELIDGIYTYWDGAQWRPVDNDQVWVKHTVVIDLGSRESLDVWDGPTWAYKEVFAHGELYKVLSINGEPAIGKWLVKEWSMWQPCPPVGRIISDNEVEAEKNWNKQ